MHPFALASIFTLFSRSALANLVGYLPFSDPVANANTHPILAKRQGCPLGYNSCSALGADGTCCPSNTNCALDQVGNVACCPFNAVCTGTIGGTGTASGTATSSSIGFVSGTTTTTNPFVTPSPTITGVAGGGSPIPNAPYPFVYIPTSYANAALCSSYFTSLQSESSSCLVSLAGANGVTVTGLGFGISVQGASGTVLSAASSICSTLSTSACYNQQVGQCSQFGGSVVTANAAAGPRQTGCAGMVYAVGAGAIAGAVGALV